MKLHSNSFERILLLFVFQESVQALKGSCVEIPCTFTYPANYEEIRLIWYSYRINTFPQVFNQKDSSAVLPEYRGRTSLVGNAPNSCTLRINNVINGDWYYPGISTSINSWYYNNKTSVQVMVTESANEPLLEEAKDLTEGVTVTISCSVEHTCHSNPPSLKWNKIGDGITLQHDDLRGGKWRYVSKLQYNPSYKDDKTQLECKVTYPNKQTKQKGYMLNIKYCAKDVHIIQETEHHGEEEAMKLVCRFSYSNPNPAKYTWYIEHELIVNETGESITNIKKNRNYICEAHNEAGNSSSSPFVIAPVTGSQKYIYIIVSLVVGIICLLLFLYFYLSAMAEGECEDLDES
ncbi:myelin-associated glycoprotein-like [Discoglossus pictus]